MKLSKVIIQGFRSFNQRYSIDFSDETAFIGDNGSGKTACLVALNKLLGSNPIDRIITKKDFNDSAPKKEIVIEAIFNVEDTDNNAEARYWDKFTYSNKSGIHLRLRLEANWKDDGSADGTVDEKILFVKSTDDNPQDKDTSLARRSEISSIRYMYIPATRNPEHLLGNASEGILSKVISAVQWSDEISSNIKEISKKLNSYFWKEKGTTFLKKEISNEWKKLTPDSRLSQIDMPVSSIDLKKLIKQVDFTFTSKNNENDFSIQELSDGIKSLFYISNIASLLNIENELSNDSGLDLIKPDLTIFALEEPENHISPHLLGKLMNEITRLSKLPNTQVLLTSHSPSIVKRVEPEDIRYFHLRNLATEVKKLNLPKAPKDAYKYVKQAIYLYPELYFSKLVILGEGESEEIIIRRILQAEKIDDSSISIVPLGGRFISNIWRLLESLDIEHITLLDMDNERQGGGPGRIDYIIGELSKYNNNQKLEKIMQENNICKNSDLGDQRSCLEKIVRELEEFDVFYSFPLDIDFMMLNSFPEVYKKQGNPRLCFGENNKDNERIINRTLKKENSTNKTSERGNSYSDSEKQLMPYYNTIFLGNGKPVNHFLALSNLSDEELINAISDESNQVNVFERLLRSVKVKINNGTNIES